MSAPFPASFTLDVEQDCPPYLQTCRGMAEGMPRILDLLGSLGVRATFFTTGEMARRFPAIIGRVVTEGHELGCHGDLHRDFTRLDRDEADRELAASLATLRGFGRVVSFRSPYLRFPAAYLPLLVAHGLRIDSSVARYKSGPDHDLRVGAPGLVRVPASLTSSALRVPRLVRMCWLAALKKPLILFVHPWEAVDFRHSSLRWDCRFRTGDAALRLWADTLGRLQRRGARFLPLVELVDASAARAATPAVSP